MTTPVATKPTYDARVPDARVRAGPRTPGHFDVHSSVILLYLETSPILVRGTVSGRQYQFSGAAPDQSVDVRDAEALMRTGFFRRAY